MRWTIYSCSGICWRTGKFRAVIDRCYPLDDIVEAHRYADTGHKRGNIVITMAQA